MAHIGQHGRDCKVCVAFNVSQSEALRTFARLEANTAEGNRAVGLSETMPSLFVKGLQAGMREPSCMHPELGCVGSCRAERACND